jgi:hypothetical protein
MWASIPPLRRSRVKASETSLATMELRGIIQATPAALLALWTILWGSTPRALPIAVVIPEAEANVTLGRES